MNCYETLIIIKPTLTEEEAAKQVELVKQNVTELGGEVSAVNNMGVRKLAYEIQKNARGNYVVVYHKSPASAIAEIERKLKFNEDILKFFTIKYSNKKEIAQFQKLVAECSANKKEASEKTEEA